MIIIRQFIKIIRYFLHHFPKPCFICNVYGKYIFSICNFCYKRLPWLDDLPRCRLCLTTLIDNNNICDDCNLQAPNYDAIYGLFSRKQPIKSLLNNLYIAPITQLLYKYAIRYWYKSDSLPDAIIPFPISNRKLRRQGYNLNVLLLQQFPQSLIKLSLGDNINYNHIAILIHTFTPQKVRAFCRSLKSCNPQLRLDIWCICRA